MYLNRRTPISIHKRDSTSRIEGEKIGRELRGLKRLSLLSIEQFRRIDRTELPEGDFREAARLPLFQILKSSCDLASISRIENDNHAGDR